MTSRRLLPLLGWTVVAAVAVVAWLTTMGPGPAAAVEGEPAAVESARGDQLYTVHCARCHGSDGRGGADETELAPPLVGMELARVDLALRTGRMPPARTDGSGRGRTWTDADRETLVGHLAALFDLDGDLLDPVPGNPAVGRELFATHCAACHGYTGDGGVAGGGAITPRLIGLDPAEVAAAVRVGPFQMPRFAQEQIDDDGLGHLVAYLDTIAGEHATPIGLGELNPVFLSGFAALLALAAVFSCLFLAGRVTMFPDPKPDPHPEPEPEPEPGPPANGGEQT